MFVVSNSVYSRYNSIRKIIFLLDFLVLDTSFVILIQFIPIDKLADVQKVAFKRGKKTVFLVLPSLFFLQV